MLELLSEADGITDAAIGLVADLLARGEGGDAWWASPDTAAHLTALTRADSPTARLNGTLLIARLLDASGPALAEMVHAPALVRAACQITAHRKRVLC